MAALLLVTCGQPQPGSVRVFASASLAPAFEELSATFTAQQGVAVRLHTAGTARLVVQWRETAAADVFASADFESLDRVRETLGEEAPAGVVFATNQLALVFDADNPHRIGSLADLAQPKLRVALAGPEVPAGRYARRALAEAEVELRSVSDEPSVRALLAKLALGELDAAVVYASDLKHLPDGVAGLLLSSDLQPEIRYPLAALPGADGQIPVHARAFADFVLSEQGQRILRDHGFGAAR